MLNYINKIKNELIFFPFFLNNIIRKKLFIL